MSEPILQLLDASNWNLIYDEAREAELASPVGGFFPIPAFEIDSAIPNHILAVRCFSTTARSTWRFAGNLIQRISAPVSGEVSPPVEAGLIKMRVNRTRLVIFRQFTSSYELVLEVPVWFRSMRLTIWAYTGEQADTTELLINAMQADITDIKTFLIT